jgi:DNA-binding LacI/PurR family transcriptional regulator
MKVPTIKDVAREANVGVGTVSRVINNSPRVSDETRQRVLEVIDSLGFKPNLAARQLSKGKTHNIGVLSPFFTLPSFSERLAGIQTALQNTEYDLVLHSINSLDDFREKVEMLLGQKRVDGLILLTPPTIDRTIWTSNPTLPVVIVDSEQMDMHPRIMIDNVAGGRIATDYLIRNGHTKIGFLGDLLNNDFGYQTTAQRYEGFRQVINHAGLPENAIWYRFGELSYRSAQQQATDLLSQDDRPTAIFATSDMKAYEVIRTADNLGLRIPEDIAIIGFDDIETARYMKLTTVRQPLMESGQLAAEWVVEWCETEETPPLQPLRQPLEIIERATV